MMMVVIIVVAVAIATAIVCGTCRLADVLMRPTERERKEYLAMRATSTFIHNNLGRLERSLEERFEADTEKYFPGLPKSAIHRSEPPSAREVPNNLDK